MIETQNLVYSSTTVVVLPFFLTDSIPFSIPALEAYISLLPIICPLDAFRTK
jgi:hypothetical protein